MHLPELDKLLREKEMVFEGHVLSILRNHVGVDEAISREHFVELMSKMHRAASVDSMDRAIREAIVALRRLGAVVIVGRNGGYCLAATREEAMAWLKRECDSRIYTELKDRKIYRDHIWKVFGRQGRLPI